MSEKKLMILHFINGMTACGFFHEETDKWSETIILSITEQGLAYLPLATFTDLETPITINQSSVSFSYPADSNFEDFHTDAITNIKSKRSGITLATPGDLQSLKRPQKPH